MKVNHRKSAELNENPLYQVPDEIWKIILPLSARYKRESVSFELEFRLLSCVSRHWASIIDQLVPVYFSHIPYQSAWILSRFGSLTSLTIPHLSIAPDTQKIDDNFIEKFKEPIKNMTNLTSLIIKERYQSDSFTQYRTPDPFVCDSDWFRNLSNLTELEIPQCKSITNDDLSHLINLRSLKVCQDPWNFLITYEGVSKLTNLEILEVPHQKLIDINLSKLSSISHLILPRDSHIAIFDENPTMKALEGASNLKKLEMGDGVYEVKMGNLTNLTYLMINTSQKDKNLMTLTNLTHLDFGRITYTSSFRKISSNSISNLINLSTLVCHDCPSLLPAIPFLTNLTKLNIQDCATMPNNVHYISHLTNLTSLTSV